MNKEQLMKDNTRRTSSRYTPEEEKEMDEMASEYLQAINSSESD